MPSERLWPAFNPKKGRSNMSIQGHSLLMSSVLIFSLSSQAAPVRPISGRVWGVTTDSVSSLSAIATSLSTFAKTPTVRIVFDENVPASDYSSAVTRLYPVSYIMGELLDSYYVKTYSVQQYKDRATEYLNAFASKVDIWEIGNEINGEWLGRNSDVVAKAKEQAKRVQLLQEVRLR